MADAAGILFYHQIYRRYLVVKRAPGTNNGKRWSIPGGRADRTDRSLYATAIRECVEELGSLPQLLDPVGEIRLRKPSGGIYLVIIVGTRDLAWEPQLNWEHTKWRWLTRSEVYGLRRRTTLLNSILALLPQVSTNPLA